MECMCSKQRPRDAAVVTDPEAVALLADPKGVEMLAPFMERPRSAGETAAALGLSPAAMHYRLQKLRRLGLVEVARTRPRRGPAVKLYRAIADRFVVPFDATPHATLEALAEAMTRGVEERLIRGMFRAYQDATEPWALILGRDAEGRTTMWISTVDDVDVGRITENALRPDAPAVWGGTLMLDLPPSDAKELQRELIALHERYLPRSGVRDGRGWMLRLALAPVDDLPTFDDAPRR
jgi:DNA-binding transcriptional ArsR family regulator